jgi:hypothetical protein
MNSKTTHLLLVLQEKMYDTEFCVPIQGGVESIIPETSSSRYQLVIDGEYYSGKRFSHFVATNRAVAPQPQPSLNNFRGAELVKELRRRVRRRILKKIGIT